MPQARRAARKLTAPMTGLAILGALSTAAGSAFAQLPYSGPGQPGQNELTGVVLQPALSDDPNAIRGLRLQTSLEVDEIITDNARGTASGGTLTTSAGGTALTSSRSKQADLITRVNPSFTVYDVTRRLQAGLTYSPSYEKFLNASDFDRFDNFLTGTANAEVWPDRVRVRATSSVSREIINQQGALTTNGLSINNNQTTVQTYTLSPVFIQRFGDIAEAQLQYQFGYTTSGAFGATTQNQGVGTLTSGSYFNNDQWTVSLSDTELQQGSIPETAVTVTASPTSRSSTSQQTGQISNTYALNRTIALITGVGYEQISNGTLVGGRIRGPFGNVGIGLTGTRASLNVLYNLRYNSQFVSFQGAYDITPRLRLQATYGESVVTEQQLLIQQAAAIGITPTGGFVNPATGQPFNAVPTPNGVNPGIGNAIFRDRSGQVILTGTYDRYSFSVTAIEQTQTADTISFNQRTLTLGGTLARDLTEATRWNLGLGYLRISENAPVPSTENTYNLATGLAWNLTQDLTASATYGFLYRQSNLPGNNIVENSLTLGLRKTF
jgi:hypothetical protein